MKPIMWMGIVLVVLEVLSLAYQGIDYNRQKDVVDLGGLHITVETHERIPLPPVLGGLALAGGVALVIVGAKAKA